MMDSNPTMPKLKANSLSILCNAVLKRYRFEDIQVRTINIMKPKPQKFYLLKRQEKAKKTVKTIPSLRSLPFSFKNSLP
jgi:hypothetical protein